VRKSLLLITFILLASVSFAQDSEKDRWIRVQSNDGKFSIKIPKQHHYFYDEKGFELITWNGIFELSNMSVLNAYVENTLISFECYKISKSEDAEKSKENILNTLLYEDINYPSGRKKDFTISEIKRNNYEIKQTVYKDKLQVTFRQYFYAKDYIYILTTSSRKGFTKEMGLFLDSLNFFTESESLIKENGKPFSEYAETIESPKKVTEKKSEKIKKQAKNVITSYLIISNPRVPYTSKSIIKGSIQLELTFSKSGQITKIFVKNSQINDLERNAILTALRIKFLPQLENGKPVNVTKIIEYKFN
jgi:hypothetical protein